MAIVESQTGWRIAYKGDLPQVIDLICQEEWFCMGLSSLIYNKGRIEFPENDGKMFVYVEEGIFTGVLFYSNEGLLYPYFSKQFFCQNLLSQKNSSQKNSLAQKKIAKLESFLSSIRPLPFFIAGSGDAVALTGSCFPGYQPKESFNYFCMKRVGMKESNLPVPDGCTFHRAGPRDFAKLLPLEIAYQKEEVIRKGRRPNIPALKKRFQAQLREEMIYFLEKNGEIVAKAGTNAKGFLFRQFGGVYTRPKFRNMGFSTFLTATLVKDVMEEMRGMTLFVKKENKSAIKVYKKCRFYPVGDFQIDYFR